MTLTLSLRTNSYDVTIQMKALCLYLHMVIFVFRNLVEICFLLNLAVKGLTKRTISTCLHAKRYKFENNRRFRSRLLSAILKVTCAPASCSLARQNPSQLHGNRSLINKHLTFTLCHEPQTGRIARL